jgi:thymidylate synthase (FAD)
MMIVYPSAIPYIEHTREEIYKKLEWIGRKAYKSEGAICEGSAEKFIKKIIKNWHRSVIEHVSISVTVVTDRGISHEQVRHRIASYLQESTRYCNYSQERFGNEITVVEPVCLRGKEDTEKYRLWKEALLSAEKYYFAFLSLEFTPQEARGILPHFLKTEIVVTANLSEWLHIFSMRNDFAAHPDMQAIMKDLWKTFSEYLPEIFNKTTLRRAKWNRDLEEKIREMKERIRKGDDAKVIFFELFGDVE